MDIRTPEGFAKLHTRERVVASIVLSILRELESCTESASDEWRERVMDDIEADVIKLAKLFY